MRTRSVPDVNTPDQLNLYSINGLNPKRGNAIDAKEEFHGFPVLGKVEITEARNRKQIMVALQDGMNRSDGVMAKCFWPRHAI